MRCKACNRILEDSELTRKDQHGDFFDICSICLTASNVEGIELDEQYLEDYPNGSLTTEETYDTLY